MNTSIAAASATKWQSAFCLLIFGLALSLSAQDNPPQPVAVTCKIGQFQDNRPEKYQLMLRKQFADGHASIEWHSEHDSRKGAMKECENVLKAQDKIWKQQLKGNQK